MDNNSIAGTCHYAWVLEVNDNVNEINNLIKVGKPTKNRLIKLLSNERQGVIAHYILSNIYKETIYYIVKWDTVTHEITYNYNGLEFIESEKGIHTDSSKLEKCREYWIRNKKIRMKREK